MTKPTKSPKLPATAAREALAILDQAWIYYTPEPLAMACKGEIGLFDYH